MQIENIFLKAASYATLNPSRILWLLSEAKIWFWVLVGSKFIILCLRNLSYEILMKI